MSAGWSKGTRPEISIAISSPSSTSSSLAYLHLMHTGDENLAHDICGRWSNLVLFLQSRRTLDMLEDDLQAGLRDALPIGRCQSPTLSSVIASAHRSMRLILRPSTGAGSHEDTSLRSRMGSDSPRRQHRSWILRFKRLASRVHVQSRSARGTFLEILRLFRCPLRVKGCPRLLELGGSVYSRGTEIGDALSKGPPRANRRHWLGGHPVRLDVQSRKAWIVGHGARTANRGRTQIISDIGCRCRWLFAADAYR